MLAAAIAETTRRANRRRAVWLLAAMVALGAFGWSSGMLPEVKAVGPTLMGLASPSCNIKGNIAPGGERIFHVPGQRYYHETRVSLLRGERWFCTEAEARKAGWRRSRV